MTDINEPSDYEAEVKRMRETYGPDCDIPTRPKTPYGSLTTAGPGPMPPVASRIGELANRLIETGHLLTEAREQYLKVSSHKEKCEASFAQVADDLMRAIHEHREGTPEAVSYR